jgi:hypothetical protein
MNNLLEKKGQEGEKKQREVTAFTTIPCHSQQVMIRTNETGNMYLIEKGNRRED